MKKSIKLFLGAAFALLCMGTVLAMPAFAEEITEIEISKCSVTSPGPLCDKLVEVYGENSTIKYSTKKTETCNGVTSVEVNGVQTVVYFNIKPTTGDVDVSIESDNSTKDGEIEIAKCSVQSPGALCDKLIEIYGTNSTVKYSLKNTTTCKYSTSVMVDGQPITVYISKKPQTGNVDIYIDENGKLVIDGTGNEVDEEENDDALSVDKLMMEYLHEHITYVHDAYDEEHYSKINDYLIQQMNGIDIYYFMEDELESVKLLFEDTVIENPDEFIANHFFKSTLSINGEIFVIYSDTKITRDTFDNNDDKVSVQYPRKEVDAKYMLNIIIALVGIVSCVTAIIVFCVKSKNKKGQ